LPIKDTYLVAEFTERNRIPFNRFAMDFYCKSLPGLVNEIAEITGKPLDYRVLKK
jgi:hypothetical protein